MTKHSLPILTAALAGLALSLTACPTPSTFTEDETFVGGVTVTAETLNLGYRSYVRHCYACHGLEGDGRGPSAPGLNPQPRDLRNAQFKFGWVTDGLPHDDDIMRLLQGGLHGTAMLAWQVPEPELIAIVGYIKTFSEPGMGWRDLEVGLGEKVTTPAEDSWEGREAEAVAEGNSLYHTTANCWKCHPAYSSREYIYEQAQIRGIGASFDENMYDSKLQEETYFYANGEAIDVLPPDYTFSRLRVSHGVEGIYKTIRGGLGGGIMPNHTTGYTEQDILAIAYYVDSLVKLGQTDPIGTLAQRTELRASLETPWEAPVEEEAEEGEGETEADSAEADSAEADSGE
jgi:cytochrome c553